MVTQPFLLNSNNLNDVLSTLAAQNNLLPAQGGNAGDVLQTDGTHVSWGNGPSRLNDTSSVVRSTNAFWSLTVGVHKLNRLLIGEATVGGAGAPPSPKDWLETLIEGTVQNSQLAVVNAVGLIGCLGASRSSDYYAWANSSSDGTIGVAGYAINDDSHSSNVWGGYFQANRDNNGGNFAGTLGVEIDVANFGGVINTDPYNMFGSGGGFNVDLWIAAGGGYPYINDARTPNNTSAAIGIVDNGAKFNKGVIFESTSLDTAVGAGGGGVAVELASGMSLRWLSAAATVAAEIWGTAGNFHVGANFGVVGNLGVAGTAPVASVGVYLQPAVSLASSSYAGVNSFILATTHGTNPVWGVLGTSWCNVGVPNTQSGIVIGVEGDVNHAGAGTVNISAGVRAQIISSSTGTIVAGYGVRVESATVSGGGAINAMYGVYVGSQTVAGTNFAIYTAGETPSYFGGWMQNAQGRARLTAPITNNTNSMSSGNLVDLAITLIAGRKYFGKVVLFAKNSTAAEGLAFDLNGGGAAASSIFFGFGATPPGSGIVIGTWTSAAMGGSLTVTTATAVETCYTIEFELACSVDGTLIPRFSENSPHTSGTAQVTSGYITAEDSPI